MKFHILVTQKILNCPVIQLISRDFFFGYQNLLTWTTDGRKATAALLQGWRSRRQWWRCIIYNDFMVYSISFKLTVINPRVSTNKKIVINKLDRKLEFT